MTKRINVNVGALHKELKMLAVEKETSINALVVEAVKDLLNKYEICPECGGRWKAHSETCQCGKKYQKGE